MKFGCLAEKTILFIFSTTYHTRTFFVFKIFKEGREKHLPSPPPKLPPSPKKHMLGPWQFFVILCDLSGMVTWSPTFGDQKVTARITWALFFQSLQQNIIHEVGTDMINFGASPQNLSLTDPPASFVKKRTRWFLFEHRCPDVPIPSMGLVLYIHLHLRWILW